MANKYNSQVDFKKSYLEGNSAEEKFKNIAIRKGFNVKESSKNQNIFDHIDYFLTKNNKTASFDVKAMKRTNRNGSINSNNIWIELTNVNGQNGWIDGKQDCIAFEFEECFIVVKRKALKDLVSSLIDFSLDLVSRAYDAKYRLYQRPNRLDKITFIEKNDLFKIDYRIWQK